MSFVHHTSGEQPISKHFSQMEGHLYKRDIPNCIQTRMVVYAENCYSSIYWHQEDIESLNKQGEKFLEPRFALSTIRACERAATRFWRVVGTVNSKVADDIDRHSLAGLYDLYMNALMDVHAYFPATSDKMTLACENTLAQIIREAGLPKGSFEAITTPIKEDLLHHELKDWLTLAKNPSDKMILLHAAKYPLLLPNIFSDEDALEWGRRRLSEKAVSEIERQLMESVIKRKKIAKTKRKFLAMKGMENARSIAKFFSLAAIARLKLKACWNGEAYLMLRMYEKIAKLAGCDVYSICMLYIPREISDLLHNSHNISPSELSRRKMRYLLHLNVDNISLYTGKQAIAMKDRLLAIEVDGLNNKNNELKGIAACPGRVTGSVRLVLTDTPSKFAELAGTFSGDTVLVTGMTNPAMMVLIKQVKGIITDEGGIASHAAIISREMGIPCIVGTRVATQVLKDGDRVEVDADNGIVRRKP